MFGSLGFTELILILVIVLIIFGAGKLPQLGEGVGKAIKGFKKSVHEAEAMDAEFQGAPQSTSAESGTPAQILNQEPIATDVPPPSPGRTMAEGASDAQAISTSKA